MSLFKDWHLEDAHLVQFEASTGIDFTVTHGAICTSGSGTEASHLLGRCFDRVQPTNYRAYPVDRNFFQNVGSRPDRLRVLCGVEHRENSSEELSELPASFARSLIRTIGLPTILETVSRPRKVRARNQASICRLGRLESRGPYPLNSESPVDKLKREAE